MMYQTMMRKVKIAAAATALLLSVNGYAQTADKSASATGEQFGNTLNLGLGLGYGYLDGPGIIVNYELGVAKNFTLAPFIGFETYNGVHYTHSIIPIGVKGTYYFDELLKAPSEWDFYAAASLGYSINSTTYDRAYVGSGVDERGLFLLLHIGAEYHVSNKVGIYLDLGSGLSSIGVALHM